VTKQKYSTLLKDMQSKTKQRIIIALGVGVTVAALSVTALYLPSQGIEKSKTAEFQEQRRQQMQQQKAMQRTSMWKTMDQHIKQQNTDDSERSSESK